MKILSRLLVIGLLLPIFLFSIESFDNTPVEKITVSAENPDPSAVFDSQALLKRLKTQEHQAFSQTIFDEDLKMLSEDFDQVLPKITVKDSQLHISLVLVPKPLIQSIKWEGNKQITSRDLQKELNIKPDVFFQRAEFNKALNKVKDVYLKKGFYESQITYTLESVPNKNAVIVLLKVKEGPSGIVKNITFKGFTKQEERTIREKLYTKKHNILTSWMTGQGFFRQDVLDQDQVMVINLLQNEGFADAKVEFVLKEDPKTAKLLINIVHTRGNLYHFGKITFDGNKLFSNEEIEKRILIHDGDVYSPEKIRDTAQAIKDFYGQKGYIEAEVTFDTKIDSTQPIYSIDFHVTEGNFFKIGFIRIFGNSQTKTNVILRESLLIPGESFDSRKLKATQQRLENIGYFKSVNVYAVRSNEDIGLGETYRDVHVEVEETSTGHASAFAGFSSLEDVFGGVEITETNFNFKGFGTISSEGPTSLRGAGEYAHAKATFGKKEQNYLVSWMTPYLCDSLWRFGWEASVTKSQLQGKDYRTKTYGASVFTAYPFNNYLTYNTKYRARNARTHVSKSAGIQASELDQHGIVSALSAGLSFDSTDHPYKAHRGLRSSLDAEIAGIGGDYDFAKFNFINTLYQAVWSKGTLKYRADIHFLEPFGKTARILVPLSERYMLGGETTVRGYKNYSIGPHYTGTDGKPTDAKGGISAALLSVEYSQEIFSMLDLFVFFDAGSVSMRRFNIPKFNTSYGIGARVDLLHRFPFMVGYGFPINPDRTEDVRKFFFSMGGQF